MSNESYQIKRAALQQIAGNSPIVFVGNAKARVGSHVVHFRYCSENRTAPDKYKFNINPNTRIRPKTFITRERIFTNPIIIPVLLFS